jgi:hypothetical protein
MTFRVPRNLVVPAFGRRFRMRKDDRIQVRDEIETQAVAGVSAQPRSLRRSETAVTAHIPRFGRRLNG